MELPDLPTPAEALHYLRDYRANPLPQRALIPNWHRCRGCDGFGQRWGLGSDPAFYPVCGACDGTGWCGRWTLLGTWPAFTIMLTGHLR